LEVADDLHEAGDLLVDKPHLREALSLDLVLNRGGQGRDLGGWKVRGQSTV
jgi:hypothetical protein